LWPRQGHGKVKTKNVTWESHPHSEECEKMWGNETTHSQVDSPFWELESLGSFELSENDLKGQNSLYWRVPYIIEKLLKYRCLKWVHIIHLSTYNTSYGQKKGRESKCQFDSWPLKVQDRLELHAFKGPTTYFWKFLMRVTNIFRPHLNWRFAQKVIGIQNGGSPNFRNFGIHDLGISRKMTFGCSPHGQS